jgi:hypothetical protein
MAYDESTAARVRRVLAGQPGLVERKMMGGLREPHVQPMKMGKRLMSGFVRVAPEGYRTTAELRGWVLRGVDGVLSRKTADHRRRRRSRRAGGAA